MDPDGHERKRVTEPPAGAQKCGLVAAAFAADERRHGREMIRFERVAHAEQRAEARAGHEFENWHCIANSTGEQSVNVPAGSPPSTVVSCGSVGGGVHL